jgi:hypothetical protein
MPSASVAGIGRAAAPPRSAAQDFPALSNAEACPARSCDNTAPPSVEGQGSAFPESRMILRDFSPDKQNGGGRRTDLPGSTSRRLGSPPYLPEAVAKPSAQRQFGVCGAQRACWQNGAMTPNQVSSKTRCFGSQLIENTRSRHETSVNFFQCAEIVPKPKVTRKCLRVEFDATY